MATVVAIEYPDEDTAYSGRLAGRIRRGRVAPRRED
jgi:hypothetical protein